MNHFALDKEDEAIKRFVLSLPVGASGAVLELGSRAVACLVPVVEERLEERGAWSEAKNARRCALINKEIDGTLSAGEAVELHLLQREGVRRRQAYRSGERADRRNDEIEQRVPWQSSFI